MHFNWHLKINIHQIHYLSKLIKLKDPLKRPKTEHKLQNTGISDQHYLNEVNKLFSSKY